MKKTRTLKKFLIALVILFIIFLVLIGIDFYQKVFTPYAGYDDKAVTIVDTSQERYVTPNELWKKIQKAG
jgi:uncharacterized protein YpmB